MACARSSCREGVGSAPNAAITAVRGVQSSIDTRTRVVCQASVRTFQRWFLISSHESVYRKPDQYRVCRFEGERRELLYSQITQRQELLELPFSVAGFPSQRPLCLLG